MGHDFSFIFIKNSKSIVMLLGIEVEFTMMIFPIAERCILIWVLDSFCGDSFLCSKDTNEAYKSDDSDGRKYEDCFFHAD